MTRTVFWSPLLLAVTLAPAFMQAGTCSPKSGNADLLSLEIEAGGIDRLVGFDTDTLAYSVWLDGAATFVVRAAAEDPNTAIGVWPTADVADYVLLGNGSGETTIDTPADGTVIIVQTKSTGNIYKSFVITINPPCTADECDDANVCSADACNAAVCEFATVSDGTPCDFGGAPGVCAAGLCSMSTGVMKTIPMTCGNDLGIISGPAPSEYTLTVDPQGPATLGQPFTVEVSGRVRIPEVTFEGLGLFADVTPTRMAIVGGTVPVAVRSGASGADIDLVPTSLPTTCAVDASGNFGLGVGSYPSCDPANDELAMQHPGTGLYANYDCVGLGGVPDVENPCAPFVELTVIDGLADSCAACAAISEAKETVCTTIGYCSTIPDGSFPPMVGVGSYTPDANPEVLFGFAPYVDWLETDFLGQLVNHVGPDDGLQIIAQYPTNLVNLTGLVTVRVECVMDDLPDSALVSIPRTSSWGNAERISFLLGWSGEEPIETDSAPASHAQVGIAANGDVTEVWKQGNSIYSRRLRSGVWMDPELLHAGAGLVLDPKAAFADNGDALVVWEEDLSTPTVYAKHLAAATWGPSTELGIGSGSAHVPDLAMNPVGDAVVVWRHADAGANNIYARRLISGAWGAASPLGSGSSYKDQPDVALSANGDAVVVWEQFSGGVDWDPYAARLTSGTWGPPEELGSEFEVLGPYADYDFDCGKCIEFGLGQALECANTGGCAHLNAEAPQVGVDATGDAIVVWRHLSGTANRIYSVGLTSGTWGANVPIEADAGDESDPRVAVSANGVAVAAWRKVEGGTNNVYAAVGTIGYWAPPQPLETGAGDAADPEIAIDPDGDAAVVWAQNDGAATSVYINRFSSGAWNGAELLEASTGDARAPRAALKPNDDALIAVWEQDDATTTNVFHNQLEPARDALEPAIGVDGYGGAVAVWRENDGSLDKLHANRLSSGDWIVPHGIELLSGHSEVAEVAVAVNGDALAVWRQFDGGLYNVYANALESGVWGEAQALWTGSTYPSTPQVAITNSGDGVVMWGQDEILADTIYASVFASGSWGTPEVIYAGSTALHPQLAVSPGSDAAIIVWDQYDTIYASRTTELGAVDWSPPELIQTVGHPQFATYDVAADFSEQAVAVWVQRDGSDYNAYAAHLASGVWQVPELLWSGPEVPYDVDLAVASLPSTGGNAVVTWAQNDSDAINLYAIRSTSGTWGPPQLLETDLGDVSNPRVAVDRSLTGAVVWQQDNGSGSDIYGARLASGVWSAPELLETGSGDARVPQVAVDRYGTAVAVWEQDYGANTTIQANSFPTLCPLSACDSANECMYSACDPLTGSCSPPVLASDGSPCEITTFVFGECMSGVCTPIP